MNSKKTIKIRNKFNHAGSFASKNRALLGTFSFQLENQTEEIFEKLSLVQQSDVSRETNESQLHFFSLKTTQYAAILKDSQKDLPLFGKSIELKSRLKIPLISLS